MADMDPVYVRRAAELFRTLGVDVDQAHTKRTPERFVNMLEEMLTPVDFEFTTFENEGMDEMIVVSDIPFYSLCEHHVVPFFGTAVVAYIPTKKIAGLSKLPRLVQHAAKGLQTQERITHRVATRLEDYLEDDHNIGSRPLGTACILRARHLCMEMRGVQVPGVYTTTSAMRGVFLDATNQARQELLRLANGP